MEPVVVVVVGWFAQSTMRTKNRNLRCTNNTTNNKIKTNSRIQSEAKRNDEEKKPHRTRIEDDTRLNDARVQKLTPSNDNYQIISLFLYDLLRSETSRAVYTAAAMVASIKLTLPENGNQPIEYLAHWNADTDALGPTAHAHNVRPPLYTPPKPCSQSKESKSPWRRETLNCDANSYVCTYFTLLLSTFFQFALRFVSFFTYMIILNKSLFDLIWNAKFASLFVFVLRENDAHLIYVFMCKFSVV